MRFRYFDSEGTEVGVASVDALRFRIQKGAVTPDTLLYDAAAGLWAPARENALFRFLVEEDEDLLPPEMRPLMDPDAAPERDGPRSSSTAPVPWKEGGGSFQTADLDEALGVDIPEGEGVAHGMSTDSTDAPDPPPDEAEGVDPATEDDGEAESTMSDAAGHSPTGPDGFPDLDLHIPVENWERSDAHRRGSAGASVPDSRRDVPSGASKAGGGRAGTGSVDSAREPTGAGEPGPRIRDRRWKIPRRNRSARPSGSRRRGRGRPSLGGVASLAVIVFALVAVPLLVFGGEGGDEGGSAYALVGGLANDLLGFRGTSESPVDGGRIGDEGEPGAEGVAAASKYSTARDEDGAPSPPSLDEEVIENLALEVEAAAVRDVDAAMIRLRRSMGVPESPPEVWLRGRYLAAADSFPEVKRYWQALESYVASLQEGEEELYRSSVRDQVRSLELNPTAVNRLEGRVIERYRATAAVEREAVYRDLSELALQALVLHEILAARSRDISYEPFDGTGLSRDPVIEAVAEDEALGERIWSRMDRILDLLESLQGLRPVTTSQLQAALAGTPGVDQRSTGPQSPIERSSSGDAGAGRTTDVDRDDRRDAPPPVESEAPAPELPSVTDLPVPTQDLPDRDG